jgi:MHS family proline/betaine transporter-like MFS transporter
MKFTKSKKLFWSCVLGNALELYDFTLYGVFTPLIAINFFPIVDDLSSFFASLTALTIGYFARPIGAILFGYIGDKYGRKKSLILTMMMMSIATGAIGLCPSYAFIGIASSIILFFARFIQGLCAGGETTGATIFLIENNPERSSSFSSAMIFVSGGVGCLIALFLGNIFLSISYSWGWRIPFLLGLLFGIFLLWLRLKTEESSEFIKVISNKKFITKFPIVDIMLKYPIGLTRAILCGALSGVMSSTIIVFINLYLFKILKLQLQSSLSYSAIGLVAFLLASFFCTKISSSLKRDKIILFGSLGLIVTAYPYFYILSTGVNFLIIIAQLILGLFSGCFVSLINSYLSEQFPLNVRFSGVSVGYNLGYAVCAGLFPILSFKLIDITGNIFSPAIYIIVIGILSSMAIGINYRKSKFTNVLE